MGTIDGLKDGLVDGLEESSKDGIVDATTIGEFEGIFVVLGTFVDLYSIEEGLDEVLGNFVEIVGILVDLYSIDDGAFELLGDFVLTGLGDFVLTGEVGVGAGDFVDERTIDLAIIPEFTITCA